MTPEERARLICSEFAVVERRHWPALLAHEFRLAMAEEREACAKVADGGAPSEIEADPIAWAEWIAAVIRARA